MEGSQRREDVTVSDAARSRWTAERLLVAGGLAVLVGIMALGLALALSARSGSAPAALLLVGALAPIGFALAFAGLVRQGRSGR